VLCVLPEHILVHQGLLKRVCVGEKILVGQTINITYLGTRAQFLVLCMFSTVKSVSGKP